jgi:hypothetical protein
VPLASARFRARNRTPRDRGARAPIVAGALARPLMSLEVQEVDMLWTIAIILLVLWALGLISSVTMGGFVHILLVAAIVLVLVRVIQGRRPVE